jgi:hypothetical protein
LLAAASIGRMKTTPLDFLLSGIAMMALTALAFAATALFVVPFSRSMLGEYHVIGDALALLLAFGLIAAFAVRLVLWVSPLVPGDYAMDAVTFVKWKLVAVVSEFGRGALLPFTTEFSKPIVARLFGAKIGRNTALGGRMSDLSLISVGDECIFGINSVVTGHAITSGKIILRKVRIGRGATLGVGVVVMPGANVGEGAVVAAGSVVALDSRIPPGQLWGGIPARMIKETTS